MRHGSCDRAPRGWWCALERGHDGPCPAWPRWWNLTRMARAGRRRFGPGR